MPVANIPNWALRVVARKFRVIGSTSFVITLVGLSSENLTTLPHDVTAMATLLSEAMSSAITACFEFISTLFSSTIVPTFEVVIGVYPGMETTEGI